ncbi:MAG: FHA domain-containing protein [Anaerolineae bacterium]
MPNELTNAALLIWQEGEIIKAEWALDGDEIIIGRDPSCQVQLPSRWISRVHVRLHRRGSRFVAEDAGSKNGVFVNGHRIYRPQPLTDGDRLQLAPGLDLIFVDSEATAPLPGRSADPLRLDAVERQVYIRGQLLSPPLSTQQYNILATLAEQPGKVYSRFEVITAAWPGDDPAGVSDDALDAMVRRLRQRLAEIDPGHEFVVTVRGYGFKLNLD